MKRALLILCCLALLPTWGRAEKYALLVGVDGYPEANNRLLGCLEDVKNVQRLLVEQLGYASDKITVLADSQATRARIEECFRRDLIARARADDEVFFYFSGHGSFIPDESGAEADGNEGVLCPYDANDDQPAATLLADHQLRDLLAALPTDRAIVVLDSCHSGNITTRGGNPAKHLKSKYMRLGFDPADYNALPKRVRTRGGGAVTSAGQGKVYNPRHIILAGCAGDQSAYIDEPVGSVFTQAFVRTARSLKSEQATYDDLVRGLKLDVESYMREHGGIRQQSPQAKGLLSQTLLWHSASAGNQATNPAMSESNGERKTKGVANPAKPQPDPALRADFPLTVSADKKIYHDGESMRVNIQTAKDCFLRLYHRDVNGNVQLIFPNSWQQNNYVQANQPVTVPGAAEKFQFTAEAPFGSELVVAVASTRQFTDLEKTRWKPGEFIDYGAGPTALASIRTRGIRVEAARPDGEPEAQLSTATAVIRVRQK